MEFPFWRLVFELSLGLSYGSREIRMIQCIRNQYGALKRSAVAATGNAIIISIHWKSTPSRPNGKIRLC